MEVFVVKKTSKAHIQMVHVPQFIVYTNFPLGITREQVVEAQHSFYDALYHRYRTNSVISSTYLQHLLQSFRHYNDMHVEKSVIWGVRWVENGGTRVVNEP